MKYDAYNKKDIEEMLNDYLKMNKDTLPSNFKIAGITKDSSDYNADKFLELYSSQTAKVTHKKFIQILLELKNSGLLDDYSITVVNKLIGDRKLFKKIQFCWDGSYRNNRIWGNVCDEKYKLNPDIGCSLWIQFGGIEPVSSDNPKEYINWLYSHFDILFLQIPMDTKSLEIQIKQRRYDDMDNDYCYDR